MLEQKASPFAVVEEFKPKRRLCAVTVREFLEKDIKPREMLLSPILPQQGLAMLYSWRGIGKTHVALNVAYAVASGGKFLKWDAPRPHRVIVLDGEMPARAMQERLASIVNSAEKEPPAGYLKIITPDFQDINTPGIPSLTSREGQDAVEEHIADGCDLLVIDNIATLCRVSRDNDVDGWLPMQGWILDLRRRGMSVLLVHHSNKGGTQRGTSGREDVLDTSISLRRPADYHSSEGARFEIHLEKARGIFGEDANPFEAKLETLDGRAVWTFSDIEDSREAAVKELLAMDMSIRDIAEETGLKKSTVHRIKKRLEEEAGNGD